MHPWETGLDNSPAWDAPLHAVPADLSLFETYTRRDLDHARAGERPTDEDYARYIRLALAYRDPATTTTGSRQKASSSSSIRRSTRCGRWSELALAEIARSLGRDARGHLAEAARITAAVVDHLWRREPRPLPGSTTRGPVG